MRSKLNSAQVVLVVLVAMGVALAAYVGVRGMMTAGAPPGAGPDEAARREAFDEAMSRGNLSFEEARYWQRIEGPTTAEPSAAPATEAGP
jgi:hypothetical protein